MCSRSYGKIYISVEACVENAMLIKKKLRARAGVMEDQGRSKASKLDDCTGQRSRNYNKKYSR